MTIYQVLWTFFLYSFLGWCTEVIFQAFKTGKFINRGFLLGPVCPIYGFGVVAVVALIAPISGHILQAYLVAALVPTILEYVIGWLTEKVLHTRLWDYSHMPLNINGYVCLLFSLIWGAACLIVYYFIHPMLMILVGLIPKVIGWVLLGVFTVTILTDFILTGIAALNIPKALAAVEEMEHSLRRLSDSIGETLSGGALTIREKGIEKKSEHEEKIEVILERLEAQKLQVSDRLHTVLEPYQKMFGKRNKVHDRLRRAFPHLDQTAAHKKLEQARTIYARLLGRKDK